jgi:hypothetical protein
MLHVPDEDTPAVITADTIVMANKKLGSRKTSQSSFIQAVCPGSTSLGVSFLCAASFLAGFPYLARREDQVFHVGCLLLKN